jgi:hypothetical protein
MFEQRPDAAAPPRQLRFAPPLELVTPLTVQLFLSAEEEFTDNADQTKDNRRSEFGTRVVPGISIRADRPVGSFSLSYAPQVFLPRNSIGDTELNQRLTARAALFPTGKFQVNIADDFTDSNDFRDVEDPGSRRTGRTDFLRNTVTAEAAYAFPKLRTGLAYTNIITQEDRGGTDTRITHVVRPNATYIDPRFTVGGSFGLTRGDENSSISTPYWNYGADGRFQYVVTPTIGAGLAGSYEFQEPDTGSHFSLGRGRVTSTIGVGPEGKLEAAAGVDVFSREEDTTLVRPSFLAAYTHRFATFAVTARYEQGFRSRFQDVDSSGVTFTRSAGLFFTTAFFRNTVGTLGLRYEENEFQDTTVLGAPAGTTDHTWSVDVEVRYMIIRSLFLVAGYNGVIRTSTQDSAEFYENRVRLGMTYQYTLF